MGVNELHLCMGCMSPLYEGGRCPVCGFDPQAPANPEALPLRARVGERYLVGRYVSGNPEGAWYVGYDMQEEVRVWIREYCPRAISRRDPSGAVLPVEGAEAQFKALMSDFEDLCMSLRMLPAQEKVVPVVDLIHDNNTAYAVYQYIKTITLESFLERSGGRLSWRHTKKLLMPLYHTVANVHRAGIIHRGLSTETIHLDQSGALWLGSFAIAAARTNKSELSAQLFEGYAAPEQYSLNSWQGTWTDVYALGAITYRALTGKRPPSAQDRVYGDDLLSAGQSQDITDIVVNAVNRALSVEVEDRTQTAEVFIADLLSTEGSDTAVYTTVTPKKQPAVFDVEAASDPAPSGGKKGKFDTFDGGLDLIAPPSPVKKAAARGPAGKKADTAKKRKKRRKQHPVLLLICSALVATGLLGAAVYYISTTYLSDLTLAGNSSGQSSSQVSVDEGSDYDDRDQADDGTLPDFKGLKLDSVIENEKLSERYNFARKEAYNSEYAEGVIFGQQPEAGVSVDDGGTVTLFVSLGIEKAEVPQLVGLTQEEAEQMMKDEGITTEVIPVQMPGYEAGVVARTEPAAMERVDKNKDVVILYVAKELSSKEAKEEVIPEEEEEGMEIDIDSSSKSSKSKKSAKSSSQSSRNGLYNENGEWVPIN